MGIPRGRPEEPVDRRGLHRGQGLPGRAHGDLRYALRRLRPGPEQGVRDGGAPPGAEGAGADGPPSDLFQARLRTGRHERASRSGQDRRTGREVRQGRPGQGSHRRVREALARRPPGRRHSATSSATSTSALGQNDRAIRVLPDGSPRSTSGGASISQALAICKKIHKLTPDSPDHALKLGDLYVQQGFAAEAKAVYARSRAGWPGRARPPRPSPSSRRSSSSTGRTTTRGRPWPGLFRESGNLDAALAQLNESADVRIEKGQLDEAAAVLNEALILRPGDARGTRRPGRGLQAAGAARPGRRAAREGARSRRPTTSSSSTSSATSTSRRATPRRPRRSSPGSSPATPSTSTPGSSWAGSRSSRTSSTRPTSSSSPSSTTSSRSTRTRRPSASWASSWRARSRISRPSSGWP